VFLVAERSSHEDGHHRLDVRDPCSNSTSAHLWNCYICLSVKSSHHLSRRYDELFTFHLGMVEQTTRHAIMDTNSRTGEAA
jgi:hypothetical protein